MVRTRRHVSHTRLIHTDYLRVGLHLPVFLGELERLVVTFTHHQELYGRGVVAELDEELGHEFSAIYRLGFSHDSDCFIRAVKVIQLNSGKEDVAV